MFGKNDGALGQGEKILLTPTPHPIYRYAKQH